MSLKQDPLLLITMGDPAGIGPEICVKALMSGSPPKSFIPVLIGNGGALEGVIGAQAESFERIDIAFERGDISPGHRYLIDLYPQEKPVRLGRPSPESGERSMRFLREAVDLLDRGTADGLVTGPISKEAWRRAGYSYPGHTEFLREASGADRTEMAFLAGDLRVALFSTHASLSDSIRSVKCERLVSFIEFVVREFVSLGLAELRVGVAGLNPHAGEGGLFGHEDELEVRPAIEQCRASGIDINGPFPADTLFHAESRKRFDLIIALYHDQGLIPVKTLYPWQAVNVTLGLPFVRTSPAHGTAFDIAGKGTARAEGMIAAIDFAVDLVSEYKQRNVG